MANHGRLLLVRWMTIFDRYLLTFFFKILLICFISFAGLFIVIHAFTNLEEVGAIIDQSDGLEKLFFEFYGPQVLDLFNRMSGILILGVTIAAAIELLPLRALGF